MLEAILVTTYTDLEFSLVSTLFCSIVLANVDIVVIVVPAAVVIVALCYCCCCFAVLLLHLTVANL